MTGFVATPHTTSKCSKITGQKTKPWKVSKRPCASSQTKSNVLKCARLFQAASLGNFSKASGSQMTSSSPVARLFTTLPRKTIPKAQKSLPDVPVPLLYHPKDSRKQNTQVTIPGTTRQEVLVLNDTVNVTVQAAEQRTDDWCLGYALTVHSSKASPLREKFGSLTTTSSGPTWPTWPFLGSLVP